MRYYPEFEYKKDSWIWNIYRFFGSIFGEKYGIQAQVSAIRTKDGKTYYAFHTVEAVLVNLEAWIRKSAKIKFPFKVYIPQLATPEGVIFQSPYLFAIAYDTSGNAYSFPGNTATIALAGTGTDRFAIMFTLTGSVSPFTSMTVDGNNATAKVSDFAYYSGQHGYGLVYVAPPTSSVNYVYTRPVDVTNDMELGVLLYSGVNQSTTIDSFNTGTGNSTLTLTTTVVASNCWLVSCIRNNAGGTNTGGSGTTERQNGTSLSTGDSNGTVGTGSQSMVWTNPGSASGGIIFSITVPTAAGPTNLKSLDTNVKANIKSYNTNLIANIKSINTNA